MYAKKTSPIEQAGKNLQNAYAEAQSLSAEKRLELSRNITSTILFQRASHRLNRLWVDFNGDVPHSFALNQSDFEKPKNIFQHGTQWHGEQMIEGDTGFVRPSYEFILGVQLMEYEVGFVNSIELGKNTGFLVPYGMNLQVGTWQAL